MNNRGQLTVGLVVVLFMGVIVSMAMMTDVINTQYKMTNKLSVANATTNLTSVGCYASGQVNESNANCNITLISAQAEGDWRNTYCPITSVVVKNNDGTALTLDTDYKLFASDTIVQMLNTTDTNSTNLGENVKVDFTYCDVGYNKDSSSRGIAKLISLFAALSVLAFVTLGIRNQWFR